MSGPSRITTSACKPARFTGRIDKALNRSYWWLTRRTVPYPWAYIRLLNRIHQHMLPRTYLEVGVAEGWSMTLVLPGTVAIGIDPEPKLTLPIRRSTRILATTSDDFFESHDLRSLLSGRELDLAFIDGMHHFEFALRDFMHIERYASRDTVVLIHDCYPQDEESAARERTGSFWSGDVWRLIVLLKNLRPDLDIAVIDVSPTGLGLVRNLDSSSTVLWDDLDAIVSEYMQLPYSYLETADKAELLNRVSRNWETVSALLPPAIGGSIASRNWRTAVRLLESVPTATRSVLRRRRRMALGRLQPVARAVKSSL